MSKTCGILFLLLIFVFAFRESSDFEKQVVENYMTYVHRVPHEKVYVHTDKNIYAVGEDIWFRGVRGACVDECTRHPEPVCVRGIGG